MDDFIKLMEQMLQRAQDQQKQELQAQTPEEIGIEQFRLMYPHYPSGEFCDDADCQCEGTGQKMVSSALN